MSPALAHHYFGSKDQMFLLTMREILRRYGALVRKVYTEAVGPRARVLALLDASLGPEHFDADTIAAWLSFYALAQQEDEAARLLRVYHRRLRSNLLADMKLLLGQEAKRVTDTLGALIDGVYLRQALEDDVPEDLLDLPRAYFLAMIERA